MKSCIRFLFKDAREKKVAFSIDKMKILSKQIVGLHGITKDTLSTYEQDYCYALDLYCNSCYWYYGNIGQTDKTISDRIMTTVNSFLNDYNVLDILLYYY